MHTRSHSSTYPAPRSGRRASSRFVCAQLVDSSPVRLTDVDDARRSDQHGAFVGVEVLVPGWFALQHDELRFGQVPVAPEHVAVEAVLVGEDADSVALRVVDPPRSFTGRA